MDIASALEISRVTLATTILLSLPLLGVALVIGLVVSIFQAVTQVNELTLTFVPKLLGVLLLLLIILPWLAQTMMAFTIEVFSMIGG